MVKISYGHIFCHDCESLSLGGTNPGWLETRGNMTDPDTTVSTDGDVFTLTGTTDQVDALEWLGLDYVFNSSFLTTIYKKCKVRWKTGSASNALRAEIAFIDAGGEFQRVVLGYSQTWKTTTIDLTAGKTCIAVKIYAAEDAASNTNGTYSVYFDFIFIYKDDFTFPNVAFELKMQLPSRQPVLDIPNRSGDLIQGMGSNSIQVDLSCDLDIGDWKRPADYIDGEIFYDIWHNGKTEPWQWLDMDDRKFKVRQGKPIFTFNGKNTKLEVTYLEQRLKSAQNESYLERLGMI